MSRATEIAEHKKWQAESVVRTLTEAEVIKNDGAWRRAAGIAARRLVKEKEKEKEANAMKRVATPIVRKKKVVKKV